MSCEAGSQVRDTVHPGKESEVVFLREGVGVGIILLRLEGGLGETVPQKVSPN